MTYKVTAKRTMQGYQAIVWDITEERPFKWLQINCIRTNEQDAIADGLLELKSKHITLDQIQF